MSLEPEKFFIGLMDFFSILLPGALFTYLMICDIPWIRSRELMGAEAWAAFLVTSYLFGHLAFLLGSWLDEVYGWVKRYTLNEQIVLLARRGKLLHWLPRALVWLVFKRDRNLALKRVDRIKAQTLAPLQAKDAINAFQWCKAVLAVDSPESFALVERFEADSKFFRSFAIVLLVLTAVWSFQELELKRLVVGLVLLFLALWRYMEQRFKATNQAYWAVITLAARDGKVTFDKPTPAAGGLTHAGGVVYRMRGGQAQYLLVEAKDHPEEWVLPKGHIEEGEQPRETAVREVHEETGVWGKICRDLSAVSYPVNGNLITVQFFLMECVGLGLRSDVKREHMWSPLPLKEAIKKATHPETQALLQSAEQFRVRGLREGLGP